jgi:hypothetical protein
LWSVGKFVNNNFTDGFPDGQSAQKINYPLLSIGISIDEYNISPTKNLMHFIGDFFFLSVGIFID